MNGGRAFRRVAGSPAAGAVPAHRRVERPATQRPQGPRDVDGPAGRPHTGDRWAGVGTERRTPAVFGHPSTVPDARLPTPRWARTVGQDRTTQLPADAR